jgi:hypothetical protein
MVTWKEFAAAEPELSEVGRSEILRDAKHMADPSEIVFELWLDRVMHTRWGHVLTPEMRPVYRKWRAAARRCLASQGGIP